MRLPNAKNAVVDIVKLRDYCLNDRHPRGRYKARLFQAALGLTRGDAELLRELILYAAHLADHAKRLTATNMGNGSGWTL